MGLNPTQHIQRRRGENVRIGPLSLLTLIIVLCMAVMAVLAASTAHATAAISDKQANASERMYSNERAAQELIAGVDDVLAPVRQAGGTGAAGVQAVSAALDDICQNARQAGGSDVTCTANMDGNRLTAEFICHGTRLLNIAVTIQNDATYRIVEWKMSSAQQEDTTSGHLWMGA